MDEEMNLPDTVVSEIELAMEDINFLFDEAISSLLKSDEKDKANRLYQSKMIALNAIRYSDMARTTMLYLKTMLSVQ